MGMFFSNIHCRQTDSVNAQAVRDAMAKMMEVAGYQLTEPAEDSDIMYICGSDCGWISVYTDSFTFASAQDTKKVIEPLSETLHTDVLAVACFDSDYLFMHLVNTQDQTDAWANVGKNPDGPMPRRTNLTGWKNKVSDFDAFKTALRMRYVFAEEVFERTEATLGLPFAHACLSDELAFENDGKGFVVEKLHFRKSSSNVPSEALNLVIPRYSLMPCQIGKPEIITALNTGGTSKGLVIAFSGDYVEHDEITFENVQLEYHFDLHPRKVIPLTLEKREWKSGQYVFYCALPDFKLPEKVDESLGWKRKMDLEFKREFGVRFTPVGDPAKVNAITLHFIPMKTAAGEGRCAWNASRLYFGR